MHQLRAAFDAIYGLAPSISELRGLSDAQLRELQDLQAQVDHRLIALEQVFRAELVRRGLPLPDSQSLITDGLAISRRPKTTAN